MKLWLLKAVDGSPFWEPWYDKAFGFVIRAEDESLARAATEGEAGGELKDRYSEDGVVNPWLDPAHSTCEELTADGPEGVVLRDFAAA